MSLFDGFELGPTRVLPGKGRLDLGFVRGIVGQGLLVVRMAGVYGPVRLDEIGVAADLGVVLGLEGIELLLLLDTQPLDEGVGGLNRHPQGEGPQDQHQGRE